MNKYNGDGGILVLKLEFKDKQLKVTLGDALKKALLSIENEKPIIQVAPSLMSKLRGK